MNSAQKSKANSESGIRNSESASEASPKPQAASRKPVLYHLGFGLFSVALILVFLDPIQSWFRITDQTTHYSHLIIVPLVSAFLFWRRRGEIFARPEICKNGIALVLLGVALAALSHRFAPTDYVTYSMIGFFTTWMGGFLFVYGNQGFKAARFPLFFLFLSVPLPVAVLHQLVELLQGLSIEVTYFFFKVLGTPIFRQGPYFLLPRFDMEVAEECSGIRSALTFLVLSVLLGGTVLKQNWSRFLLPLLVIPIVVLENTLRILGMYFLAVYVHEDFLLPGRLHNLSGTFAFGGALFLLFLPTVALLRWGERRGLRP